MEASSITNKLFEQLNFRGEKQKVISSNIANINTAYVNKIFDMVENKTQGGALP